MHLVVCGNDASGKTTIVERLSDVLQLPAHYENWERNPYLGVKGKTFESQMFFLDDAYTSHQEVARRGGQGVQDRTLDEHIEVFARYYHAIGELTSTELAQLRDHHRVLAGRLRPPDLLLCLSAPVDVLHHRLMARANAHELQFAIDYLVALDRLYTEFFSGWRKCPVIAIDTAAIDYREKTAVDNLLIAVTAAVR